MQNAPTPLAKPRMLDTSAAAEYLGLSASTLAKMRIAGNGPTFRKIGPRRVVYHPDDLAAWLDASSRRSTSERSGAK